MRKAINHIVFSLRHTRLPVFGLVGLAVIVLVLFIELLPRKKIELIDAQSSLDNLRRQGLTVNQSENSESPVSKFYKKLPDSHQLKPMLEFIFELTADKRLTIDTINYELEELPEVSFATYKIQAPVTGTYLDLMKFIQKILETYPSIALTNISIGRESSQSNLINAEIELSVHLKKDNR